MYVQVVQSDISDNNCYLHSDNHEEIFTGLYLKAMRDIQVQLLFN